MAAPVTDQPQVPGLRLAGTLALAGMLAGTLIVTVYQATLPAIEKHKAEVLQASIHEVLSNPDRLDTLYVVGGALAEQAPPGSKPGGVERIFVGYKGGERVGYALNAAEPGFQDVIELIFGYDHESGEVVGMKVLESKETPGLGDKVGKDPQFLSSFRGVATPIVGVKAGHADAPGEIDMITGATISSKAVIRIINNKLERLKPMIDAYEESP